MFFPKLCSILVMTASGQKFYIRLMLMLLGFNEAIDQSARMRRIYMLVLSCVEEEGWSCLEKGSRV